LKQGVISLDVATQKYVMDVQTPVLPLYFRCSYAVRDGFLYSEEWVGTVSVLSSISSFGQDENCELYLVDRDGKGLYRIVDAEGLFSNGFEQLNCQ